MGVDGSYLSVFYSGTGGTKILGMLVVRRLGMLAVFNLWILLEGEGLLFKQSSPLEIRVPRDILCLGMLAPLRLGMLNLVYQLQSPTLGIRKTPIFNFIGYFCLALCRMFGLGIIDLKGVSLRRSGDYVCL